MKPPPDLPDWIHRRKAWREYVEEKRRGEQLMSEAKENFDAIAAQLVAAGLPIPAPLTSAMAGEFQPLALDTRERWPVWARERGYSDAQIATLHRAVGRLVRHPAYIEVLATDLSERVDAGGNPIERVRPEDRMSGAMLMLARAMKEARKAAKPPKPTAPTPQAAAAPSAAKRPILSLKPDEIQRRRAALAAPGGAK